MLHVFVYPFVRNMMAVPATQLFDLLKGRKLSSLMLLENASPFTSSYTIWAGLCKQLCEKYSCLVVRTELPGNRFPPLPPSIKQLNLFDFEGSFACLKAVHGLTSSKPSDDRQFVVFFESIDGFLLDCPSEVHFGHWCRQLASYMTLIAASQFAASVVCSFNTVKHLSGELTWTSEVLCNVFEDCAATCVKLSPAWNNVNQIGARFWHRRTQESIYKSVRQPGIVAPSNKPTVSAECCLIIDPSSQNILNCILASSKREPVIAIDSGMIPASTFKLSLSQKEIEDRQKVVLPYKTSAQLEPCKETECKIEYDADEFDDIDDEDPDDDLEI